MLKDILLAFWFFFPAGIAIVVPLYAAKLKYIKKFSYPADFYATFRKRRVFGSHKTIRGFILGTIGAILTVYLQVFLYEQYEFVRQLITLDYTKLNPLLLGFLLGFGGLAGDSIKSFFKRQVGIAPGKSWFPFDQTDHIFGGIFFTAFYIRLTLVQYILLALLWFFIHLLSAFIGYLIKLKKTPL